MRKLLAIVVLTAAVFRSTVESRADQILAAAESSPGGSVLTYDLHSDGTLTPLPPISSQPTTAVNDPVGVQFSSNGELFVGNRENFTGGSVPRFTFDSSGNYAANGVITGNSLDAVHDLAFSPTGELFAANRDNQTISRFTFDASGNAVPNGTISHPGFTVGMTFTPWGELFVTDYQSVQRYVFDAAGDAIPNGSFSIPGTTANSQLHFLRFDASGELFVPDVLGTIYKVKFDAGHNPIMDGQFSVAPGDIGLAFSSSGELFVGNQSDASNGGEIYGYTFDNSGNPTLASYLPVSGFHITGVAIGASVPEPSAVVLCLMGFAVLASSRLRSLLRPTRRWQRRSRQLSSSC